MRKQRLKWAKQFKNWTGDDWSRASTLLFHFLVVLSQLVLKYLEKKTLANEKIDEKNFKKN